MVKTAAKTRGDIAPDKTQVNWRIRTDVIDALRADCHHQGFQSIPSLVNFLLVNHYFGANKLRNVGDR